MTSPAIALREAVFQRLENISDYNRVRKTRNRQLQPEDLPALSVLVVSEEGVPDGELGVGDLRFVSTVTLGISLVRAFELPDAIDERLDGDAEMILDTLLTDPTFVRFEFFEGVERLSTRRREVPVADSYAIELQMEIAIRSRSLYEPKLQDNFRRLQASTTLKPDDPHATVVKTKVVLPEGT